MKTSNLLKGLLILSCCFTSFALVSCGNDDDNNPVIPNAKEVLGEYSGKMMVNEKEDSVNVTVDSIVTIDKFPVKEIVTSIVAEDDLEEALGSLKDLSYSMNYTAKAGYTRITLALAPEALSFEITIKEKKQKVEVTFASEATGTYDSRDNTLTFLLNAESVSIDGEKVESFEVTDFQLLPTKKK